MNDKGLSFAYIITNFPDEIVDRICEMDSKRDMECHDLLDNKLLLILLAAKLRPLLTKDEVVEIMIRAQSDKVKEVFVKMQIWNEEWR